MIDSTNSEIVETDSSIKMQESGAISNQPEAGAMLAEEVTAALSVSYQTHSELRLDNRGEGWHDQWDHW